MKMFDDLLDCKRFYDVSFGEIMPIFNEQELKDTISCKFYNFKYELAKYGHLFTDEELNILAEDVSLLLNDIEIYLIDRNTLKLT